MRVEANGDDIQIDSSKYQLATRGQVRKFKAVKTIVVASLLPEVLYAWFTEISATAGIQGTFKNIFGVEIPKEASDGTAWVFAALDFVINNILFNPDKTAKGAIGLEEIKGQLYKELKVVREEAHRDPENCTKIVYKFIFTKFLPYLGMLCNFPVGALADYLPLDDFIKNINNPDARMATAIMVATTLVVLGVSYYLALSYDDVIEDANSLFLKFSESPVARLFRHNKSKGVDASISALSTHVFRSAVFGYIAYSMAHTVMGWGAAATNLSTAAGLYGGLEVSLLTRTTPSYKWLLGAQTKDDEHPLGTGDLKAAITDDDWEDHYNPTSRQQVTLRILGAFVGSIRGGAIAWLTQYYLRNVGASEAWSYFTAAVVGAVIFGHGYWVHVDDSQRAFILQAKALAQSSTANTNMNQHGYLKTGLAILFNFGSQAGRGFIAITSTGTLFGRQENPEDGFLNIMDPKAASVLGAFLALEVAIANFKYFHPKALSTLTTIAKMLRESCYGPQTDLEKPLLDSDDKPSDSQQNGGGHRDEHTTDEATNLDLA